MFGNFKNIDEAYNFIRFIDVLEILKFEIKNYT